MNRQDRRRLTKTKRHAVKPGWSPGDTLTCPECDQPFIVGERLNLAKLCPPCLAAAETERLKPPRRWDA